MTNVIFWGQLFSIITILFSPYKFEFRWFRTRQRVHLKIHLVFWFRLDKAAF